MTTSDLYSDYCLGRKWYPAAAALAFARTLSGLTYGTPRADRHTLGSVGAAIRLAHQVAVYIATKPVAFR